MDLARQIVKCDRFWREHWPFSRGKWIPLRIHNVLSGIGIERPWWRKVSTDFSFFFDIRDYLAQEVILTGAFGPELLSLILSQLPPNGVFVDVGANQGYYSIIAGRHLANGGRVISIEPNPSMAELFKKNIQRNNINNVELLTLACSDRVDSIKLYPGPAANPGTSSFSPKTARNTKYVTVETKPLDDLIHEPVNVVKIDVEGAELKVLRGMTRILREYRPVVILEIEEENLTNCGATPEELYQFFERHRYHRKKIDNSNAAFFPPN